MAGQISLFVAFSAFSVALLSHLLFNSLSPDLPSGCFPNTIRDIFNPEYRTGLSTAACTYQFAAPPPPTSHASAMERARFSTRCDPSTSAHDCKLSCLVLLPTFMSRWMLLLCGSGSQKPFQLYLTEYEKFKENAPILLVGPTRGHVGRPR